MTSFRVWAPRAKRAELDIYGKRQPMTAGKGGWWFTEAAAAANTEYRFALDGGEPLADPRSPCQPRGISGPSITVDHGTEFMSRALEDWAYQRLVQLDFIRPGKPVENAFI